MRFGVGSPHRELLAGGIGEIGLNLQLRIGLSLPPELAPGLTRGGSLPWMNLLIRVPHPSCLQALKRGEKMPVPVTCRPRMNISEHIYLFTIADRFSIAGRGVVVVPGIPWSAGTPLVGRGDALILRTPLGKMIRTQVQDFELIHYRPGAKRVEATAFSLPKEIHKFDIPIGTEVYLDTAASGGTTADKTRVPRIPHVEP